MGANDSHSPARRPQAERSASSPSDSALAKSHKGSSRQLHKAHAVGHGRQPHARLPSYGKGLHKLSKLGPGNAAEAAGYPKNQTRSASHTPSGSPTTPDFKRTSSHVSLPRTGSKVSFKKSHSQSSLSRNKSDKSLGNQAKGDKAQTKVNLRKKGTDDAPLKGTANFEVGDEAQDDEWTEDSSSPYTTRQNSAAPSRPKTPLARDPPSPDHSQDDPPQRSPTTFPHSPPESPHTDAAEMGLHPAKARPQTNGERKPSPYDPPDPQAVTNRLLSRNSSLYHTPLSQTSAVSASVTPPVRSSSPSDPYNKYGNSGSGTSLVKEQSMPANGISRFLDASTGSATPGSVSHLQSNLADLDRHASHNNIDKAHYTRPISPAAVHKSTTAQSKSNSKSQKTTPDPSSQRRTKSAANLHRTISSTSSLSPPVSPSSATSEPQLNASAKPAPSPFSSARGADPSAGKSLTQLKLDLQRLSTQRADAPSAPQNNPLLVNGYGGMLNTAGLWGGEGDMAARVARQWESARKEVDGGKRFWPEAVRGGLVGRRKKGDRANVSARKQLAKPKSTVGSQGSDGVSVQGRGRIRFEVGSSGRSYEDEGTDDAADGSSQEMGHDVLEGLVRRMWVSGEVGAGE